jgi:hypothetical protein
VPREGERSYPEQTDLEQAFGAAGAEDWRFVPGSEEASRRLSTPACWDLRGVARLVVQARVKQAERQAVRLRWHVESRVGGCYAAHQSTLAPMAGAPASVELPLWREAAALSPVGHQRPWDELAAAEVRAIELRAEVVGGRQAVVVELRDPRLDPAAPAAQASSRLQPQLLDVALDPPRPDCASAATLCFRIEPLPDDPFAVSGEGDVRVRLPDGSEVLAYLDQSHHAIAEGWAAKGLPAGPPRYLAHIPKLPQTGALVVSSGTRQWQVPRMSLAPPRLGQPAAPQQVQERPARWAPPLEAPTAPAPDPISAGRWPVAPGAWKLVPGREVSWRAGALPREPLAWRPVLFWNSQWGSFAGVKRADLESAGRLDLLLADAQARGRKQPLILLDGEPFTRQGMFNWLSHPLNAEQGGPLSGPGQMLRVQAGLDFCLRSARYALARWGCSKAVSCLLLAARPSSPGVADFHARLASALSGWVTQTGKPLYTLHPLPREPEVAKVVEGLDFRSRVEAGQWRAGEPLPALLAFNSIAELGGDRGQEYALEVNGGQGADSVCALKPYRLAVTPCERPLIDDFGPADALMFDVWLPAGAPSDLRAGVHLRDRDSLWFQTLLPGLLNPGDWTTCILDLTGRNAHKLAGVGHQKPWTDYSRGRLIEIGLHVYTTHRQKPLSVRFARMRGVRFEATGGEPGRKIELVEAPPRTVRRGEVWECHLRLSRTYGNPFDPRQVDLAALITAPSGRTLRAPAFFDQPCRRTQTQPTGAEVVEPAGPERWTVRFRVLEEGPHSVSFELCEGGRYQVTSQAWAPDNRFSREGEPFQPLIRGRQDWVFHYEDSMPYGRRLVEQVRYERGPVAAKLDLPGTAFTAAASAPGWRGFVRADADGRHFRYDDGSFYYALGPCLRSPSDNRKPYADPKWTTEMTEEIGKRGTYQYDEYLAAFQKAGINWTRIWLCSWWGGLQWRRDWPGYQGLGFYNLLNAWRMDHVLDEAERRGIGVSLCLTNHGQVSRVIDVEWHSNPLNSALGGPLGSASEFFTRAAAKISHQNFLRYVTARWGHSAAIMAWDLFSELEFTEEYRPSLAHWPSPDRPSPHIDSWHTEMAAFLKELDPNKHLVGTHYSHPIRGAGTLALPAVEIATSNAYSAFDELAGGNYDAAAALDAFWNGCQFEDGLFSGFRVFRKPALVQEQGRHWMGVEWRGGRFVGNTRENLDADLHASLWGSLVQPLAGATGYWWWLHVHYDDRYGEFRALANFVAGEDFRPRRGESPLEPVAVEVQPNGLPLTARVRRSQERAYIWVYHRALPFQLQGLPPVHGARLLLGGFKSGRYMVEYWNTRSGRLESRAEVEVRPPRSAPSGLGALELLLPPVNGDVAVKAKRIG